MAGRHILPIPVHASSFRRHARCFRILLINQYTRPRNRNGKQEERRRFHCPADAPLVSARREALLNATHTSHQQTPFVQRARRPSVPCRAETRVYTLPGRTREKNKRAIRGQSASWPGPDTTSHSTPTDFGPILQMK